MSFFMVLLLIVRLVYPLPGDAGLLLWLSRLDPLLALSQVRSGPSQWFWVPAATVVATLLFGRVFCGWLCPLGGLLNLFDVAGMSGLRRTTRTPAARWARPLRALRPQRLLGPLMVLRHYWLWAALAMVLLATSWPSFLSPYTLLSHEITRAWYSEAPWVLLSVLAAGLLFFPRFWCVYVCPTGLLLTALSRVRLLRFSIGDSCTRCGACVRACPVEAARPDARMIDGKCIVCGRCREVCPVGAVTWAPGERSKREFAYSQSRRDFIKAGAIALVLSAGWRHVNRVAPAAPYLRPPGAVAEEDFVALCNRCGRCIKVCPNRALWPAPLRSGLAVFETPQLVPRLGRCDLCLLCQEVCPTGAIRRVPVEQIKIGTAVLDQDRCLAWLQGIECLVCVEQCPYHAVMMDELARPVVIVADCSGCGACENACPVEDAAIHVRR